MEQISMNEMAQIMGGKKEEYNICRELQAEAAAHKDDPSYDWDAWTVLFMENCI
jgi:bacteriocin-like protein